MLVLSRPQGAPSLGDILTGKGGEAGGSFEQWELYGGVAAGNDAGQWEELLEGRGDEVFAQARQMLAAFAASACCKRLHISAGISGELAVAEQPEADWSLVLLDAGGGAVTVRAQSWQDMVRSKMATGQRE